MKKKNVYQLSRAGIICEAEPKEKLIKPAPLPVYAESIINEKGENNK